MRHTKEQTEGRLERSKLRAFGEDVVIRQFKRDGASSSHIERHQATINYAERFAKDPIGPEDVDPQFLLSYDAWLWRKGISESRRRDLVESLKRIAVAWSPHQTKLRTKRCARRILPDPPPGSVRHQYETVYAPIVLVGRSARYIDENRAAFWRLYEHYGRDPLMEAFRGGFLIAEHMTYLIGQGLKPATINSGHVAIIGAVLRDAHRRGTIDFEPIYRKLPIEVRTTPDSWTSEQVAAFYEACDASDLRRVRPIRPADWWRALVQVVRYTGLRRRALFAIRRADVDLETGWLTVPGSSMKNRRGDVLRLGADALEAITKIWEPEREYLLPYPYATTTQFYEDFHRIRESAGLPRSQCNAGCLHLLRRSTATEVYLSRGIEAAQTIMGHSSPKITLRNYVDPRRVPAHDFTAAVPPLPTKRAVAAAG